MLPFNFPIRTVKDCAVNIVIHSYKFQKKRIYSRLIIKLSPKKPSFLPYDKHKQNKSRKDSLLKSEIMLLLTCDPFGSCQCLNPNRSLGTLGGATKEHLCIYLSSRLALQ